MHFKDEVHGADDWGNPQLGRRRFLPPAHGVKLAVFLTLTTWRGSVVLCSS